MRATRFEAAQYFARLNAAEVTFVVRTIHKGEEAAKSVLASIYRRDSVVEAWEPDSCRAASIKAFAQQADGLNRHNSVVENPGISLKNSSVSPDRNEMCLQTNVISTYPLALLRLPEAPRDRGKVYGKTRIEDLRLDLYQIVSTPSGEIYYARTIADLAHGCERSAVTKVTETSPVEKWQLARPRRFSRPSIPVSALQMLAVISRV